MEHSYEVAAIAHCLAIISKSIFHKDIDPGKVLAVALYHDASEVLTGDLPSPIKYHNKKIRDAYKEVEKSAELEMLSTLPEELKAEYRAILLHENHSEEISRFVKAADLIASLIKCKAELNAGNKEFERAIAEVEQRLARMQMPEKEYFCQHFLQSFDLTLDELITHSEQLFPDAAEQIE